MDLRALVEARATAYRAIQARAGVSLRCLDPDAAETPPITSLSTDGDGEARAVTVRVQGPLDDWFGFDVRALISDLDEADPQSIHLLIESPGGFLADGLALYTDLRARARSGVTVTAEARGVVASAAVLPFLAAETRTMTTGTELMIHNPWSLLLMAGTADDIEDTVTKVVAGLRSAEKTNRDVLVERTGASRQKVTTWLKDDTWFAPEEAVAAGFATAVMEDTAAAVTAQDVQALAVARRVLAAWRLTARQETAA